MPRGGKKIRKAGTAVGSSGEANGRGSKQSEDPLYAELDQRMKTLQLPAACSFIFGIVERYVRSLSSHEPMPSSLPSLGSLLSLIDTHILRLPPVDKIKRGPSTPQWPFTVFEELELLDLLRVQIEERQSVEVQLALFDALFGVFRDNQHHVDHCVKILEKLVSLSISMGCSVILQCAACWMELYPVQALELSKFIYFEFCELLPNAMEPLLGLCSVCPAIARLFTYHLTSHYHIHSAQDRDHGSAHTLCPPLRLLSLLSHWITTTPEYMFVQTLLVDLRDQYFLLRSQKPRIFQASLLPGLIQWSMMEPLVSDKIISHIPSNDVKGKELVTKFREEVSKLHADTLTGLLSISSPVSGVNVISVDELVGLVANFLDYIQFVTEEADLLESSVNRFAQMLQAGLTIGVITLNIDSLAGVVSKLPQNRLLKLVLSKQRKTTRNRDH